MTKGKNLFMKYIAGTIRTISRNENKSVNGRSNFVREGNVRKIINTNPCKIKEAIPTSPTIIIVLLPI